MSFQGKDECVKGKLAVGSIGIFNSQNAKASLIIAQKINELQEEIDAKRMQDQEILNKFKHEMIAYVENVCSQIEGLLNEKYMDSNAAMESKLHELSQVMMRITNLESELDEYGQAIGSFVQSLQQLE